MPWTCAPLSHALLTASLAVSGALTGCDDSPRLEASGPNLVLVVIDTLRADRLSQYGHEADTSSSLHRVTDSATRFDECYSPAPWTAPAVASIFTGLAPGRHGVDAAGDALPTGTPTLASELQAAGWQTAAISFNPHVTRAAGFAAGFDDFLSYRGLAKRAPDVRAMTRRALEWIDERRPDTPFFLYLQPMNVHGPYRVPPDAADRLLGRPPREGFTFFGPLMKDLMNEGRIERRAEVGPDMLTSLEEQYDTAIRHTADELAVFFDALAERGLFDDSLIVVTSDHGEELFDHGGFAHRYSLYREVLRVPLFVREPGQRELRIVSEPVSIVDLRATLAALLGLPHAEGMDGHSLVPLLRGRSEPALANRPFVAQATNHKRFVGRSIRRRNDELIVVERSYDGLRDDVRLYDLEADPGQQHDLSHQRPELVRTLRGELEQIEAGYESTPLPSQRYELDPELRGTLEALGYL